MSTAPPLSRTRPKDTFEMLILHCPFCDDPRDEAEFSYLGEAFIKRPERPDELTDPQWADYLFMRKNTRGWFWEQWQHSAGCRKIFAVRRHTASYQVDGSWPLDIARALFEEEKHKAT